MNNHNPITLERLGFASWLELFEHVKKDNLQDEPKITLTWGSEDTTPDVTINMATVRANAFAELYEKLPTQKALDVVDDLIFAEEKVQRDLDTIKTFLQNLPTRSE